ncbi:MAG: hypothetical protein C0402_16570, partial [Thermodesulfovibrio sp.]|nr:hypothetical protein [Thermodesulfovibrio sp.]
ELADFKINLVAERNPTPPQFFRKIDCVMHIAGKNIDPKKVDRAVSLSQEKYCSVYNSLRKDMEVNVTYTLEDREPPAERPVID